MHLNSETRMQRGDKSRKKSSLEKQIKMCWYWNKGPPLKEVFNFPNHLLRSWLNAKLENYWSMWGRSHLEHKMFGEIKATAA